MIDELERVKAFRAAEPPPDEQAERSARASLERVIAQQRTPARAPRRRRRLGGLALVGACVLAALLVGFLGSTGTPSGPGSAAAAVFDRLARVVATQSLTPGPGQYLYVDSRAQYSTTTAAPRHVCVTLAVEHRQIWIGANGSGLLRESFGPASFTSPADRAICRHTPGGISPPDTSNTWFAPHCLTIGPTSDWKSLSSNPRVLLRQMRRIDGGPPTHAEDFVHIGDFLRETDAPPRIRAAIYRAAALIPGVKVLGEVRDHDGGLGLGVAYSYHGSTSELIFDSHTGELLGEQGSGPPAPYWAVYLRDRIVNRLPSQPPAPLKPACGNGAGKVSQRHAASVVTGAGGGLLVPKSVASTP